jgi:hypothetical protein
MQRYPNAGNTELSVANVGMPLTWAMAPGMVPAEIRPAESRAPAQDLEADPGSGPAPVEAA